MKLFSSANRRRRERRRKQRRQFFAVLRKVVVPFFRSEYRNRAIGLSLCLVLLLFAVSGVNLVVNYLGRRLISLHNRQFRFEANFRYGLIRVRDNAESIAFFRVTGMRRRIGETFSRWASSSGCRLLESC